MAIEHLANLIPSELLSRSGSVFYSGRNAFSAQASLYVLGINPGGCPDAHKDSSVGTHTAGVLSSNLADWSAYRDERWEGRDPGTVGMAPRILHLFRRLNVNPGSIPASNMVFARSRREGNIAAEMRYLKELCWPFHARVISTISPRVIVCLGQTVGSFVRSKIGAHNQIGEFVENNNRRWRSRSFSNTAGIKVVVATHPSIANWCSPATDPTSLVIEALVGA